MGFMLKTKVRFICEYIKMDITDTGFEEKKNRI
jgi:hypothetical protein